MIDTTKKVFNELRLYLKSIDFQDCYFNPCFSCSLDELTYSINIFPYNSVDINDSYKKSANDIVKYVRDEFISKLSYMIRCKYKNRNDNFIKINSYTMNSFLDGIKISYYGINCIYLFTDFSYMDIHIDKNKTEEKAYYMAAEFIKNQFDIDIQNK